MDGNYEIIKDTDELTRFIDRLPELKPEEKFYCCLLARDKYAGGGRSRAGQVKRFLSDKKRLFVKIRQLEVPTGSYRISGEPVRQDALVLYVMPNPRCMVRASYGLIAELARNLRDGKPGLNPHAEALSMAQNSRGRTVFLDFDIDGELDLDVVKKAVNEEALLMIRTRGGWHVLVRMETLDEDRKKTFYRELAAISDQKGDILLPVPGCVQGEHVPRVYDMNTIHGADQNMNDVGRKT